MAATTINIANDPDDRAAAIQLATGLPADCVKTAMEWDNPSRGYVFVKLIPRSWMQTENEMHEIPMRAEMSVRQVTEKLRNYSREFALCAWPVQYDSRLSMVFTVTHCDTRRVSCLILESRDCTLGEVIDSLRQEPSPHRLQMGLFRHPADTPFGAAYRAKIYGPIDDEFVGSIDVGLQLRTEIESDDDSYDPFARDSDSDRDSNFVDVLPLTPLVAGNLKVDFLK
jgi:hypothetical protein